MRSEPRIMRVEPITPTIVLRTADGRVFQAFAIVLFIFSSPEALRPS
jgi:hypothetical protein